MAEEEKRVSVGEVRRTIATTLAAAFGFVIALMWNNVVIGAFAVAGIPLNQPQSQGNWGGWGILVGTAIGITIVLIVFIIYVGRWGSKK